MDPFIDSDQHIRYRNKVIYRTNLMIEKFVLSVKKEALALPLLHVLLKLFVHRSLCRRFVGVFEGIKAFVLEQRNNLFNI